MFVCVGSVKFPLDLSEEEWDNVFKINLTGCWLISKYVCKLMCDAKQKGSIINIGSTSGINRGQQFGAVAYTTSKAGLNMFTVVILFDTFDIYLLLNHYGFILN
jgi:NAD(P)-dependent dehydrogenase (short-subunit alcohol dehydrogenase family)